MIQLMLTDLAAEARALRDLLSNHGGNLRHIRERLEAVPAAALLVDDAGHYVAVNRRACELTGYTREELLARSIPDLTSPEELAAQERLWRSFERTQHQSGKYRIVGKDGAQVEVAYDAFWDIIPGIHASFLRTIRLAD